MRLLSIVLLSVAATAADPGWPKWRGPFDNGMAAGDAPLKWSDTQGIAWRVEVPGRGNSTPVIAGDRIFLTTAVPTGKPAETRAADSTGSGEPGGRRGGPRMSAPPSEHKFIVQCYDRKTGKLLWERVARTATPHEGYHPRYGSFASNSPVTDGKHVVAFFGSRGVYVYTVEGKPVWDKDFGVQMRMTLAFGEGSWPALEGDKLLLLFDHEGESFLVALDKNTGKELWRAARPNGTNWSGPVVITHAGRKQVVVSATKKVAAYDLETGKQIWQATGLGRNTIPAPVASDGIVVAMSGFREPNLLAIRLGREGDLTGSDAILWQNQRGNSYTPSPVLHDGKLYMLTDSGMLSCLDLKTGKPYYAQQRLPKPYNFKASPVGANGKLYLASEEGDVIVVKMGENFEVLATNTLENQMFVSSPAIVDGAIYLRSQTTLFCVR